MQDRSLVTSPAAEEHWKAKEDTLVFCWFRQKEMCVEGLYGLVFFPS